MTEPQLTVDSSRRGDTLVLRDRFAPNAKQADVFRACSNPDVKEVLAHGSLGWGKTQAAIKVIVAWAMRYPGVYLVGRTTYGELEETTKRAMMKGEGGLPPALPPQLVAREYAYGTHNKTILVNGSEILFRGLEPDHRGKIRNLTLAGLLIDQAEQLEEEDDEAFYEELLGRLRQPNAPRKAILVANPGPEDHWLCVRFGCTPDTERELTTREVRTRRQVHGTLYDNQQNLPADYVEQQVSTKETRPDHYRRYVLGEWGAFGGKRYKLWTPHKHVVNPFDIDDQWEILAGMDFGASAPTVYLSLAITMAGRWLVTAEHYEKEQPISHHARRIKLIEQNPEKIMGFYGKLSPSARWLDPSAWSRGRREHESVAMEFIDHGIVCAPAQNERLGGWNRIEEYMVEDLPDGLPRLQIFSTCTNLIRELRGLKYKPGTDDVEKKDDHAPDALRYAIMSRTPTPIEQVKTPQEAHTRSEVAKRIYDRATNPPEVVEVVS